MKITLCCLCACLALNSASRAGTLPDSLANSVQRVEKLFNGSASTEYKLQVMIVAPGVFIDPPPDSATFANLANVIISVDALSGYEFLQQILVDLRSSKWARGSAPGYPRWYWRIVGPSESVVFDLLIDEENSAIGFAGDWYAVDPKLVNRLTREFVDSTTKTFSQAPNGCPYSNVTRTHSEPKK